jgi:hypothetical protein
MPEHSSGQVITWAEVLEFDIEMVADDLAPPDEAVETQDAR